MVGAYLYRDILELEGVRRSEKIVDLLRLVAFPNWAGSIHCGIGNQPGAQPPNR